MPETLITKHVNQMIDFTGNTLLVGIVQFIVDDELRNTKVEFRTEDGKNTVTLTPIQWQEAKRIIDNFLNKEDKHAGKDQN